MADITLVQIGSSGKSEPSVRDDVLARATTRLVVSSASQALDAFKQHLRGAPHEILRIPRSAGVMDACVAFATIAAVYHPRQFTNESSPLRQRAHRLYERLRRALRQQIASLEQD
jgi:hypothetical protein